MICQIIYSSQLQIVKKGIGDRENIRVYSRHRPGKYKKTIFREGIEDILGFGCSIASFQSHPTLPIFLFSSIKTGWRFRSIRPIQTDQKCSAPMLLSNNDPEISRCLDLLVMQMNME